MRKWQQPPRLRRRRTRRRRRLRLRRPPRRPLRRGIEASSGQLVLLLNDDTTLEPGALAALVDTFRRNPSWGACQAKLLLMDEPDLLDTAGSFLTPTGFLVHRGAFELFLSYEGVI